MTKEVYESLSPKEKMMYEELAGFAKRLAERMDEMTLVLKAMLQEANGEP